MKFWCFSYPFFLLLFCVVSMSCTAGTGLLGMGGKSNLGNGKKGHGSAWDDSGRKSNNRDWEHDVRKGNSRYWDNDGSNSSDGGGNDGENGNNNAGGGNGNKSNGSDTGDNAESKINGHIELTGVVKFDFTAPDITIKQQVEYTEKLRVTIKHGYEDQQLANGNSCVTIGNKAQEIVTELKKIERSIAWYQQKKRPYTPYEFTVLKKDNEKASELMRALQEEVDNNKQAFAEQNEVFTTALSALDTSIKSLDEDLQRNYTSLGNKILDLTGSNTISIYGYTYTKLKDSVHTLKQDFQKAQENDNALSVRKTKKEIETLNSVIHLFPTAFEISKWFVHFPAKEFVKERRFQAFYRTFIGGVGNIARYIAKSELENKRLEKFAAIKGFSITLLKNLAGIFEENVLIDTENPALQTQREVLKMHWKTVVGEAIETDSRFTTFADQKNVIIDALASSMEIQHNLYKISMVAQDHVFILYKR